MLFHVGLENNIEGRSLAWVLDYPGCFAYGVNGEAALVAVPQAIREYVKWIARHSSQRWLSPESIEISLDEVWDVYWIGEDYQRVESGEYEVNAWFQQDWKPLSQVEIQRGLLLLSWTRHDLLQIVGDLTPQQLEAEYLGERWNIAGILRHVGGAEWWYLDRLGFGIPREDVPEDSFSRLRQVRACLEEVLPRLAGVNQVLGVDGEFWSPRKLLRRAAWHERDHTTHILKLLGNQL
jgi:hypothetical protein